MCRAGNLSKNWNKGADYFNCEVLSVHDTNAWNSLAGGIVRDGTSTGRPGKFGQRIAGGGGNTALAIASEGQHADAVQILKTATAKQ